MATQCAAKRSHSKVGKYCANVNPIFCSSSLPLANGKTVNAKVVDKCPGCAANDVDLSPAAFEKLADLELGRLHGGNWTIS